MNKALKKDLMEDPEDLGLQAVMGKRFQDRSRENAVTLDGGKKDPEQGRKAVDVSWVPAKVESTEIQRLVECVKQTCLYGGVSALLFWWQQAGLLASEAALPSFIVLALLAGLKIGRCMAQR